MDETEVGLPNKQEDLQVHDRSPVLLVEIKGLAGQARESDTIQVIKYVSRRMKQWERMPVKGLCLVNHQRNLPALNRDHVNAFTKQQEEDAEQHGTGLMTTWDLFRLLRGKMRWNWSDEVVCDLFYRSGRISPYPAHYALLGNVAKYWPEKGVVSIEMTEQQSLKVGDRIGFLLPIKFHEEEVTSLQVGKQTVPKAVPGNRVGHKTTLAKADIRLGMQVFKVSQ